MDRVSSAIAFFMGALITVLAYLGGQLLEVQKEIRNELQTLNRLLEERIECVPLVYDDKAELRVGKKKQ